MIKDYCFKMNGLHIKPVLDVIPVGLYYVMIVMDWLESHHVILDCRSKIVTCLDEYVITVQIKGF